MTRKKQTIAILFGGCSTEHNISLQSASAVLEHMDTEKYQPIPIGITRKGCWYLYEGDMKKIIDGTWESDKHCTPAVIVPDKSIHGMLLFRNASFTETIELDAAFPVLHGKYGEDGTIQGLLELAGIPIIGCKTLTSSIGMDKALAHLVVSSYGISVPASISLHYNPSKEELIQLTTSLTYPLFVKPANAGSSFGISKVTDEKYLSDAIETAFEHSNKIIIEEAIDGFEVGCAILGDAFSKEYPFIIGQVDEIELSQGFFDFTEKYTLKTSQIHMPARISKEMAEQVKKTAIQIYQILDCTGFARVDMFLTPNGTILFNEINTIPGFTSHSRYPNMLKGIGMTFEEIITTLIERALIK